VNDIKKQEKLVVEDQPGDVRGVLTLNEEVVSTIAGLAARDVDGVYSVGKSGILQFRDDPTRGIGTEVGKLQAAFDVDIVIEYGQDIRHVAQQMREKMAAEVSKMAGREVVEININVVDIHLPGEEKETSRARVQ
jgi:uncharacterized alkaline shock family protein YloU